MKAIRVAILFATLLSIIAISSCSKSSGSSDPSLVSPANRTANVPTNQVFTCSLASNIITYRFFFTDITNSLLSFSSPTQIGNTYTPTQLVSGHTYTWSVSVDTGNGTLGTQTWSFTVQ